MSEELKLGISMLSEHSLGKTWKIDMMGDLGKLAEALDTAVAVNEDLKILILDVAHRIACNSNDQDAAEAIGNVLVDAIECKVGLNSSTFTT